MVLGADLSLPGGPAAQQAPGSAACPAGLQRSQPHQPRDAAMDGRMPCAGIWPPRAALQSHAGRWLSEPSAASQASQLPRPAACISITISCGAYIQSDPVTPTPLVCCKSVTVSWMSLYRCTAMYCWDRACPPKICHCNLDVTVSEVAVTRSDCIRCLDSNSGVKLLPCQHAFQVQACCPADQVSRGGQC